MVYSVYAALVACAHHAQDVVKGVKVLWPEGPREGGEANVALGRRGHHAPVGLMALMVRPPLLLVPAASTQMS